MTKPISAATQSLLDAMDQDASVPGQDKLDSIRYKVLELRDLHEEKANIEERLTTCNKQILDVTRQQLPEMMDNVGLTSTTLSGTGNSPPFSVRIEDYYHANIPSHLAPEAYKYLHSVQSADLIKTQFTVSFGLGESEEAEKFEAMLVKRNLNYDKKQGVPWNTLTAWVREEWKHKPLSAKAMEVLGATVCRVAKVVKPKEKK